MTEAGLVVRGTGNPVTLFAHGFAGSIAQTRPFASGVSGTRVFFHFGGHGDSVDPAAGHEPARFSYRELAADLLAVADQTGATHALGVSMGAGALLAAAVARPGVFSRIVLALPAAVSSPRADSTLDRVEAMAVAADAGDVEELARLLLDEQPSSVRDREIVVRWARGQAQLMCRPPLRDWMRVVPRSFPIARRDELTAIRCPVLVIGQEDDEAHPAALVAELVSSIPDGRGVVLPPGGVLWTHRSELRRLVSGFLNDGAPGDG